MAENIARCKCCLENGRLKSMWRENRRGGVREVYGTMLTECFRLHWSRPQNPKDSSDLICEKCILRLRDAVNFKTEVLASEQLLSAQVEGVDIDKLKQERDDLDINIQTDYLHYESLDGPNNDDDSDDCTGDIIDDDAERNIDHLQGVPIKIERFSTLKDNLPFSKEATSNVEVTRIGPKRACKKRKLTVNVDKRSTTSRAATAVKRLRLSRKAVPEVLKSEDDEISSHCKVPAKIEIEHFNDITESLSKAVEAVHRKQMSEAKAAITYNVACELIAKEISKVQSFSEHKEDSEDTKSNVNKNDVVFVEIQQTIDDDVEDIENVSEIKKVLRNKRIRNKVKKNVQNNGKSTENRLTEMKKQANNIAIILEFTNATPIRRHGGIGYGCCFCNEEFPDAADLKQHTIKEHDVKTKRNYAKGKRPSAYLVKLDITGLKCNLCGSPIDSLEQLYDHLIEVHKKLLYRNAKNYIIPFKFDQEELRCLFCEFICNSFKGLHEHMSIHYRNHICEICDAGFLTKNNLFNHAGRHKKGTFKCDYCPKVFDTTSKKAGHQRAVHSSTNGVNRCGYCGEMFGTYRRKEKHLITEHGVTLKKLKCKACDKTFETQTALRIHTKRDHLIERRFKCSVCDKRCFTSVQLSHHTLKHTGIKKFQCTICLKAYGRKYTLREHMRIHENDRRFKCELCGMAFVQKCSWRGHMLSKHGQQV